MAATRVPAGATELIEGLVRHFATQRSKNMVLHRLGAPGIHESHLLPRHAIYT